MAQSLIEEKLQICKSTRKIAADSLYAALKSLLGKEGVSEAGLRDRWLSEMNKYDTIFSEGWYSPPPYGIAILFGTDTDNATSRLNCENFRPEGVWPRDDVFLNRKNGIVYAYASPVDRKTGIIGDFGMTVYLGNNQAIQNHLKTCYEMNRYVFDSVKTGKKFSEIYGFAERFMVQHGLNNKITSTSDPAGTNIGHTVPGLSERWTEEEQKILESEKMEGVKRIISAKRKFVSSIESFEAMNGMAVTVEPRPRVNDRPEIPMMSYHTIILIHENGKSELLTGFDSIFRLTKMDYMLK